MVVENLVTYVQYCQDDYVIDGSIYAEDDADCIRFWSEDMCLMEIQFDGHCEIGFRQWKITASDVWIFDDEELDLRFSEITALLTVCALRRGTTVDFGDVFR